MPWDALDYDMIDYCKALIAERKKRGSVIGNR
jgi:hypothetical protein